MRRPSEPEVWDDGAEIEPGDVAVSVAPDPTAKPRPSVTMQVVHDRLRRMILDRELQEGTEISQLELGRRLEVGRTPLREALRLLEREGLVVDSGRHKLVQISPVSMVDLDDLYSLRIMGEALAIWLTVPALRSEDLAQLEMDLTEVGNPEAHRRFHRGLRLGAGARLQDHLERLFEHAERYQRIFMRRDTGDRQAKLAAHQAILAACYARDRVLARDLLIDHLATTAIGLMTAERHAPFALLTAVAMAKSPPDERNLID